MNSQPCVMHGSTVIFTVLSAYETTVVFNMNINTGKTVNPGYTLPLYAKQKHMYIFLSTGL
jgi:hypothetical protein